MKKVIIALCAVLCVAAIFVLAKFLLLPEIGTISGAENEYIVIGENKYEIDCESGYTSNDRDKLLGVISSGDFKYYIFSIEGTKDYIFRLWEWEGAIYKKSTSD